MIEKEAFFCSVIVAVGLGAQIFNQGEGCLRVIGNAQTTVIMKRKNTSILQTYVLILPSGIESKKPKETKP